MPFLGRQPLADFGHQQRGIPLVQRWRRQLLIDRGYAPKTVNTTHTILYSAIDAARLAGLVGQNVVGDVKPPSRPSPNATCHALSPEDVAAFERASAGHQYEQLWRVLMTTGLRFGEATALRWREVELRPGREHVIVQWAHTRVRGGVQRKAPKTESSRRSVPLFPEAVAALRAQRARVAELRLAAGPDWHDEDLVFPDRSGRALRNGNPLEHLKRVLTVADLDDHRLHDFRHTYATQLHARGVDLKTIQQYLGHASIRMTADMYTGSSGAALRDTVERLGSLFATSASA